MNKVDKMLYKDLKHRVNDVIYHVNTTFGLILMMLALHYGFDHNNWLNALLFVSGGVVIIYISKK